MEGECPSSARVEVRAPSVWHAMARSGTCKRGNEQTRWPCSNHCVGASALSRFESVLVEAERLRVLSHDPNDVVGKALLVQCAKLNRDFDVCAQLRDEVADDLLV